MMTVRYLKSYSLFIFAAIMGTLPQFGYHVSIYANQKRAIYSTPRPVIQD